MADKLYEGMFLLDSNRFSADPDGATNEVLGILGKAGATVVAHRPWQEGRLAYEVEGQRKGLHYLTYFRTEGGTAITDINRSVQLSEMVLRHLVIQQPKVLFEAMVEALNTHDAAQHSAHMEEREERPRRGRPERPERGEESDDESDENE